MIHIDILNNTSVHFKIQIYITFIYSVLGKVSKISYIKTVCLNH